ncbi:MAG: integrase [Proteobacteria bacterium]|nr:MAG: integrase [Pseudomonadota bacterium]
MRQTLNDRFIDSRKPAKAGQRYEVWDAIVPGLGIRITDRGTKTFVLATRYPGSDNPTRRALGEYGKLTLEQARNKARRWLELVGQGIDPHIEIERQRLAEQRKQVGTFANLAEAFIREKLSTERRGRDAELHLRKTFIPRWGKRPAGDITADDVGAVINEVKAHAPYMAHALLATVRRVYKWASTPGRGYGIIASPCYNISAKALIGEKRPRTRVLSDAEIRAFVHACDQIGYPYGSIGRMLLLTGARHREVSEAPWTEFDLTKKTWTIDQARFKSSVEHIVPLTDDVRTLLEELPRFKRGNHVFSTTFGEKPTMITDKIKKKIDALMARELGAKPKPWVVHDLRRTVRSHLAALRIPDHVAEMVLGHGRQGLQRVYDQHRYEDEMREALTLWAGRLRDIVEPSPANVVKIRKARAS